MLSYKEFIAIMKDRLHRGFKVIQSFAYNFSVKKYTKFMKSFYSFMFLTYRFNTPLKVSQYGMEYNEELTDEYEDGVLAFPTFMRSRACRKLRRQFRILQM